MLRAVSSKPRVSDFAVLLAVHRGCGFIQINLKIAPQIASEMRPSWPRVTIAVPLRASGCGWRGVGDGLRKSPTASTTAPIGRPTIQRVSR